jgi:hypothetical protein
MHKISIIYQTMIAFVILFLVPTVCAKSGYGFEVDASKLSPVVNNPRLFWWPGDTYVYRGETEDGVEEITVTVTDQTREIIGVKTVVVHDTVRLDGVVIEDTYDWYAQHKNGTVLYFGEDSTVFENGVPVSKEGSWEAGIDGAKPGIVMLAKPRPGRKYRQEYYPGVAEDMAAVEKLNARVTVPFSSFTKVLRTRDWTPLEPGVLERKFYAMGVGLILEVDAGRGGSRDRIELISVTHNYEPGVDDSDFPAPTTINNQFLPLVPGTIFTYETETEDGMEVTVVEVTHDTREVMGVTTVVVRDTVRLEGVLVEDTRDWFAQDDQGNVWYFGEETTEYEDGVPVSTEGSWEAGVDGALPGILMLADPQRDRAYRQEFLLGEAEDKAVVRDREEEVAVPLGSFDQVLRTEEWTELDPGVFEDKYYAPGVGLVLVVGPDGSREELVSVTIVGNG